MTSLARLDRPTSAQHRLTRAALEMPVLQAIVDRYAIEQPLRCERIALCGHITEATAIQVRTLGKLGAEIAWCASSTATTDDDIGDVMAGEVGTISGKRGMSMQALEHGVTTVLGHFARGPTLILDEGARLLRALNFADLALADLNLAAEKTPEGIEIVRGLELKIPVLTSDMSIGKRLMDNPHGTGQSLIDTIVSVTRCLLAGKVFLVCGYGRVGAGVARKARGLGARVLVAEVRPTRALVATLDGFEVMPIATALSEAQIVLTVAGHSPVIGAGHFRHLRDGAVLVNGGHLPTEIDTVALKSQAAEESFAPGLVGYRFSDARRIYLMADGNIANLTVGSGNPNEVMDATFASQVLALIHGRGVGLGPGLHALPEASEAEVAQLIAKTLNIDVAGLD